MRGLDEAWRTWEGVKGGRQPPKRDASSPLFKVTCWQYYGEMLEGSCEKANPWKRLWKWLWAVPALCPRFPSSLHGDDPCPAGQLPAPQGGMPAPSSILSANTWACAMSQAWLGPGGCASLWRLLGHWNSQVQMKDSVTVTFSQLQFRNIFEWPSMSFLMYPLCK